jgi:type IV pilus assembly protein PilB
MGVEPYAVASGVSAVIAQRLARRLCLHCREPYRPAADVLAGLAYPPERVAAGDVIHHRAIGCPRCHGGYRGRVGLFQLLLMSDELRRLAAAGAGHAQLEQAARSAGVASLWADGLAKVEAGVTSLDELYRVLA